LSVPEGNLTIAVVSLINWTRLGCDEPRSAFPTPGDLFVFGVLPGFELVFASVPRNARR
jgi:hypothetical protein